LIVFVGISLAEAAILRNIVTRQTKKKAQPEGCA
jgi:hypothetical protein